MPLRRPRLALLCLLSALLSTGCAAPLPPPVQVERLSVPAELLACPPQPEPPASPDDRALAGYILDLADAGDDCRAKLGRVADLVAGP
jgi:hypothetical protein